MYCGNHLANIKSKSIFNPIFNGLHNIYFIPITYKGNTDRCILEFLYEQYGSSKINVNNL